MRRFPILDGPPGCPRSVPWSLVEPQERQARDNHDQTLEGLAARGGLGVAEIMAVLRGERWRKRTYATDEVALPELLRILRDDQSDKLTRAMAVVEAAIGEARDSGDGCPFCAVTFADVAVRGAKHSIECALVANGFLKEDGSHV